MLNCIYLALTFVFPFPVMSGPRGPPPIPLAAQESIFALQLPLERLHDDCRRGHKASVYEAIGEKKELVNHPGKLGYTALHWAAQCQHTLCSRAQ